MVAINAVLSHFFGTGEKVPDIVQQPSDNQCFGRAGLGCKMRDSSACSFCDTGSPKY